MFNLKGLSLSKIKDLCSLEYSKLWFKFESFKFSLLNSLKKYRNLAWITLLIIFAGMSVYLSFALQDSIVYELTEHRIDSIQQILRGLGSAFIAATAITFSLVMFAMQVNIERMPFGLFHRFSSDKRLLLVFTSSFIIGALIMALSIIDKKEWIVATLTISIWCASLIIFSFLYTYKRALNLISPSKQLANILQDLEKYFQTVNIRVNKAEPLLRLNLTNENINSTHDMPRVLYYKANPNWHSHVLKAVSYCINYSRRYADQGDHEISGQALGCLILVNTSYIQCKGKTFFSDSPLIPNPESHDPIISETLEQLRQNVQIGLSKGDELFIQANFRALTELAEIYYNIDYSTDHSTKSHAHLATGYLSSVIELALPHKLVDVCMEGARLQGRLGIKMIVNDDSENLPSLTEKIKLLSIVSAANNKFAPLTVVGVEQLANISFELIRGAKSDIRYPVREIREAIKTIVTYALKEEELGFSSPHKHNLSGYYTSTSLSGLAGRLIELVNALISVEQESEDGRRIISNLSEWSDQLYLHDKEVFLLAIQKSSSLSFDIINWCKTIAEILMAASSADCCNEHFKNKLRDNASSLISVLDWVPDQLETVQFVANLQLTESLFELAQEALRRDCTDTYEVAKNTLYKWTVKAGKHQTGFGILEKGIEAMVVLSFNKENGLSELIAKLQTIVAETSSEQLLLTSAANNLREQANNHHGNRLEVSSINRAMGAINHNLLRNALLTAANTISPEETIIEEPQRQE